MKIKAEVYESGSYDGNFIMLTWKEKDEKKTKRIYNDNPVVYGFPDKTVMICGVEFDTISLIERAGDGEIELDLDTGEIQ